MPRDNKMAKKMSFYPEFVPNQVLTDTQLNQLREYLDEQSRSTRFLLVGTGIVCGLEAAIGDARIQISEGYGVSSDGYFLELEETAFAHFRPYTDPDVLETETQDEDEPRVPAYEPWRRTGSNQGQIDIIELVDEETMASEEPPKDAKPLKKSVGEGRVLVIYLEKLPLALKSCLVTDCDNKGKNVNLRVRALLVLKKDLSKLEPCPPGPGLVRIPRLYTVVDLDSVEKGSQIDQGYSEIVSAGLDPLLKAIQAALEKYGSFLDIQNVEVKDLEVLVEFMEKALGAKTINQFHYDILKDLACAYNEAIVEACQLLTDCCPEQDFPRHLMLAAVDGEEGYRNEFIASPVRNVEHGDLQRVRKLFQRILTLAASVALEKTERIDITPSHTELYPVGERAVPFYYRLSKVLRECWLPQDCCSAVTLRSFHDEKKEDDLGFDYTKSSFLRIEGHLGHSCADGLTGIGGLRTTHNLEFDLLCLHLENPDAASDGLLPTILEKWGELRNSLRGLRLLFGQEQKEPSDQIQKSLQEIAEGRKELADLSGQWASIRCTRRLLCDTSHLESDYLMLRSESLCLLANILDSVNWLVDAARELVEDVEVEGNSGEGSRGIPVEVLFEPLLVTVSDLRAKLESTNDPTERNQIQLALTRWMGVKTALDLVLHVTDIRDNALPKQLCRFNSSLFLQKHKELAADLAALTFYGSLGSVDGSQIGRWVDALSSCVHSGLASVFSNYTKVREEDISLFSNFVKSYRGLEHLAGVEKAGTFILVSEGAGKAERVVADFSLAGRIRCCCDVDDAEICLPPVASQDVHVVELQSIEGNFPSVSLDIDLLQNDYDPNAQPVSDRSGMKVELIDKVSELGATLTLDPDSGLLHYSLKTPIPGAVDRFLYELRVEDRSCRGSDVGVVLVLFKPEKVEVPDEGPRPGRIVGTVLEVRESEETTLPLGGVTVTVVGTSRSALSDDSGNFAFADLNPGSYRVRASMAGFSTEETTVNVVPDGIHSIEFVLNPLADQPVGGVVVIVTDARTGAPVPNAGVLLANLKTQQTLNAATTEKGQVAFTGLQLGTYQLEVGAAGFISSVPVTVDVAVGTITVPVQLLRLLITDGQLEILSGRLGLSTGATKARAENVLGTRFGAQLTGVKAVASNPSVSNSATYAQTEKFLTETLLDPTLGEDEVAKAYSDLSSTISKTINQAVEANKAAYRSLLENVSHAYLDRLVLANPESTAPEVEKTVAEMAEKLKRSGVDVEGFKTSWKGDQLKVELGVSSTDKVRQLLA